MHMVSYNPFKEQNVSFAPLSIQIPWEWQDFPGWVREVMAFTKCLSVFIIPWILHHRADSSSCFCSEITWEHWAQDHRGAHQILYILQTAATHHSGKAIAMVWTLTSEFILLQVGQLWISADQQYLDECYPKEAKEAERTEWKAVRTKRTEFTGSRGATQGHILCNAWFCLGNDLQVFWGIGHWSMIPWYFGLNVKNPSQLKSLHPGPLAVGAVLGGCIFFTSLHLCGDGYSLVLLLL